MNTRTFLIALFCIFSGISSVALADSATLEILNNVTHMSVPSADVSDANYQCLFYGLPGGFRKNGSFFATGISVPLKIKASDAQTAISKVYSLVKDDKTPSNGTGGYRISCESI